MKRTLAATIACLLLGSVGVIAEQKGGPKKPKDAKHAVAHSGDADAANLAAHVSWTTHDVEIIRHHYTPKYRELPPGLRKNTSARDNCRRGGRRRCSRSRRSWSASARRFPLAIAAVCSTRTP